MYFPKPTCQKAEDTDKLNMKYHIERRGNYQISNIVLNLSIGRKLSNIIQTYNLTYTQLLNKSLKLSRKLIL